MKYEQINRLFTERVQTYLSAGWYINTASMSLYGSQGEIAKADLTNGDVIVRVYLRRFQGALDLIVGSVVEPTVVPNTSDTLSSPWNNKLLEISRETFHAVQSGHRRAYTWYVNDTDWRQIVNTQRARAANRLPKCEELYYGGRKAAEAVLPFVRRQPKCKRLGVKDVKGVYKIVHYHSGTNEYVVKTTKGTFVLNQHGA